MRSSAPLVRWMPSRRPRLQLSPPGFFPLVLSRLFEHEVVFLGPYSQPVGADRDREFRRRISQPLLALPHTRAAAEHLFGPSSPVGDDKCSFHFPLMLSGMTPAGPVRYAMLLQDVRGTIELRFYRLHGEPIPIHCRRTIGTDPGPEGLSPAELSGLTANILDFLCIVGARMGDVAGPFLHVVRSDFIIYGHADGEFFATEYESCEDYERAYSAFTERTADAERTRNERYIRDLFASCGSPVVA